MGPMLYVMVVMGLVTTFISRSWKLNFFAKWLVFTLEAFVGHTIVNALLKGTSPFDFAFSLTNLLFSVLTIVVISGIAAMIKMSRRSTPTP